MIRKKTLIVLALAVTALCIGLCQGGGKEGQEVVETPAGDTPYNPDIVYTWSCSDLPQLAVSGEQGLAGALLTMVGDTLVIGGGANFPDTPAAEGGQKKVYDTVYAMNDSAWTAVGTLPWPLAYAATAYTPEGLAVLGGNDGTSTLALCYVWKTDGTFAALPPLPYPIENAAAAYGDGYVYIAGGQTTDGPSNAVFRLSMADVLEWQPVPSLPAAPRVQCSAAWLDGRLYVAGGYNPTEGTVNGNIMSWGEGEDTWTFVNSLRKPGEARTTTLVGGAMLGDEATRSLLFIGGVDAMIFQEAISRPQRLEAARATNDRRAIERLTQEAAEYMLHEAEWYQFQQAMTRYSLVEQEYSTTLVSNRLARAGAAVLKRDSVIYVVNGELKPGIRSNTAVKIVRRALAAQP